MMTFYIGCAGWALPLPPVAVIGSGRVGASVDVRSVSQLGYWTTKFEF